MIDFDYLRSEYIKCSVDKSRVYMMEHFLKTFDGTQNKEVQFLLFPKQKEMLSTMGNSKRVVVTKPRQSGITTATSGKIACECVLTDPSTPITILCIGNTLDIAQQLLFKVRDFLLQFPLWMWGDEYADSGEDLLSPPSNKNVIFKKCNDKYFELKNGSKCYARSSGPNASRGVGGVNYLIFDEAAFIENSKDVYASAIPTVSTTDGMVILISTPNGKDQLYYETYRRALLKGTADWNGFEAIEMRWEQDPRYNRYLEWTKKDDKTGEIYVEKEPTIDSNGSIVFNEEYFKKRKKEGWSPRSPWYLKMCQQFNHDEQKIAQELDVSFLGSASNVVDPIFIEMQETLNVQEPLYKDSMIEDTWVWKEPIEGHKYICCCDSSRGDASDRSAIEIIDITGVDDDGKPIYEQVLEYHGKKTGDELGEMIYQYGTAYGNALAVVECIGGVGDATVLTLRNLNYPNIYYDDPYLKHYTVQREVSSLSQGVDGKVPGFHTSSVRLQMLTGFADMVKTNQFKIRSRRVISELETWIYKGPSARIDHMDGAHDDTLTCLAMGLFVMRFSMNKLETARKRDIAFLHGWLSTNRVSVSNNTKSEKPKKKYPMPFFSSTTISNENRFDSYNWKKVDSNIDWIYRKTY